MLTYKDDSAQDYATLTVSVQGVDFVTLIPTERTGLREATLRYEIANRLHSLATKLRAFPDAKVKS